MTVSDRFQRAIAAFDAVNRRDPNLDRTPRGPYPRELRYAERMSGWLDRLAPDASEALRLAARCQHIARWTIPRERYPMDRAGYLKWRTDLYRFHAERAAEILREVGYDAETIARVSGLLLKKQLKRDPEMQTLEDVACLVFLDHYFPDFLKKHDDDKVIAILRKTWKKMSPRAREAALVLPLPPKAADLVERALSGP